MVSLAGIAELAQDQQYVAHAYELVAIQVAQTAWALGKVADWYEQEVDDAVEALTSLLEPAIMAFLGVVIGGIVIGMYLPIFKMGQVV